MCRYDGGVIFPWENTELWETSQMSGGGKYFSNFKIGKRMNSRNNGPISSTVTTDNNEEVIINSPMNTLKDEASWDVVQLVSRRQYVFSLCLVNSLCWVLVTYRLMKNHTWTHKGHSNFASDNILDFALPPPVWPCSCPFDVLLHLMTPQFNTSQLP